MVLPFLAVSAGVHTAWVCVCGCSATQPGAGTTGFSSVECVVDAGASPYCRIRNGIFYSADPVPGTAKRVPLLVALCKWSSSSRVRPFSQHTSFGIAFDHVSEHRLVFVDDPAYFVTAPLAMVWTRGRWEPRGTIKAPPNLAAALAGKSIGLFDSGDCWTHQGHQNPWHCGATMWNWFLLAKYYTDEPIPVEDTAFLAIQGLDEMDEFPNAFGHLEMRAVASAFVFQFHDDDHITRDYIMSKKGVVSASLDGLMPVVYTNANPGWSWFWRTVAPSSVTQHVVRMYHRHFRNLVPRGRKHVLLIRRSPPLSNTPSCTRCMQNIDELIKALSFMGDRLKVVHLTGSITAIEQLGYFLEARLLIATHGGAWGSAFKMTTGQAAIEIVPKASGTATAEHFMRLTGVDYTQSVCLNFTITEACVVDVSDVVTKTKKLLLRLIKE